MLVRGLQEEADVVVEVLGFAGSGMLRNVVDIDVENGWVEGLDAGDAAFFPGFTECYPQKIGVAIRMASRLQPFPEFAVQCQQSSGSGWVEQPG